MHTNNITAGAEMIRDERERQIVDECYQSGHDDYFTRGELAEGAMAYLKGDIIYWPYKFARGMFKPGDRVRNLVKAGAMIAAEIDRLLRADERGEEEPRMDGNERESKPGWIDYTDRRGRRLFVHDGISNHSTFGTFYRKPSGSLKRLVSKNLPMRDTAVEAQADLNRFARSNGYAAIRAKTMTGAT